MPADPTTFVGATSQDTRHLELDQRAAGILAIGSQLAYGRVGLNAAQPIYQQHQLRVAAIPTTILSVLPHYPSVHQTHLPDQWITDTLDDLTRSGALDRLRAITVGYVATVAQAHAIAAWYQRESRSTIPLILDPTFGDIGLGFYNDPAIVQGLREALLPEAAGLTPNLFELAHLTGTGLENLTGPATIESAAKSLLGPSMDWVVVTGIRSAAAPDDIAADSIAELIVPRRSRRLLIHPRIAHTPAGAGDTFTAALTARLLQGISLTEAAQFAADETARQIRQGAKQ